MPEYFYDCLKAKKESIFKNFISGVRKSIAFWKAGPFVEDGIKGVTCPADMVIPELSHEWKKLPGEVSVYYKILNNDKSNKIHPAGHRQYKIVMKEPALFMDSKSDNKTEFVKELKQMERSRKYRLIPKKLRLCRNVFNVYSTLYDDLIINETYKGLELKDAERNPEYTNMNEDEKNVAKAVSIIRARPYISNSCAFNSFPLKSRDADRLLKKYIERR